MDRIKEIVLKGKVLALEAAIMSDTLEADHIRNEAAQLLKEAGGEITDDLKTRLQILSSTTSGYQALIQ